jgi:hypothetical protein
MRHAGSMHATMGMHALHAMQTRATHVLHAVERQGGPTPFNLLFLTRLPGHRRVVHPQGQLWLRVPVQGRAPRLGRRCDP